MTLLNCEWAQALTRYDCQTLRGLDGQPCLEIGTPFSLLDGSAINFYLTELGNGMVKITDNADTLFQLGGMGLDVWQASRLGAIRDLMQQYKMGIGEQGDLFVLAPSGQAANAFARAITALLALSAWASGHMENQEPTIDILAAVEPWIIARNPDAFYKKLPRVKGASTTMYTFDLRHGNDLIDVISADPRATGAAMRKTGDIQNGPFAEHLKPLIVVYDLISPEKAENEISILGSVTRAMPASRLMTVMH